MYLVKLCNCKNKKNLFLGEIGRINDVNTWIQAKKIGGDWYIDDSTVMPSDACPYSNTNREDEVRLRFRASDLKCADHEENKLHDLTCEYYFHVEQ